MNDPKDPENPCKSCSDEACREEMLFTDVEDGVFEFVGDRLQAGDDPGMLAAALMRAAAGLALEFFEVSCESFSTSAEDAFEAMRKSSADA